MSFDINLIVKSAGQKVSYFNNKMDPLIKVTTNINRCRFSLKQKHRNLKTFSSVAETELHIMDVEIYGFTCN